MPVLQDPRGVAWFWKKHRGHAFASSALMGPMPERFVRAINEFAEREQVEVVTFRKAAVSANYLWPFEIDRLGL